MRVVALIAVLGLHPRESPATRDSHTNLANPLSHFY